MKKIPFLFLLISFYSFSCNSTIHNLFDKKTPHEAYADKLDDRGLDKTPEGRAWLAASKAALEASVNVSLPYRQQGFFQPDKPRALGLQFKAKAGEKLTFTLTKKGDNALPVYADLFAAAATETPLFSADTATTQFSYEVAETGTYVLRLQPELSRTGDYSLSISVGPSLGFPVSGTKANVGSVWGDSRDAGKRKHEGVDIFAPKLTPAIAAADGTIVAVREGGLGGKTVNLQPTGKAYVLYYAHLDKQLVQQGQEIKKGDVLGLVGNTGNARFTPSHLHFGVYTFAGAIDPLPFVNRTVKTAPALADKSFSHQLKLIKAQKETDGTLLKATTPLIPLAADAKGYLAEAPDGKWLQVPFSVVQVTKEPVRPLNAIAITKMEKQQNS